MCQPSGNRLLKAALLSAQSFSTSSRTAAVSKTEFSNHRFACLISGDPYGPKGQENLAQGLPRVSQKTRSALKGLQGENATATIGGNPRRIVRPFRAHPLET